MGENIGTITQVMGPVVDVEFEQGNLPTIYTALTITNPAISDEEELLKSHSIWVTMWSEPLPWM